jgi:hypothetical protein
MSASGSIMSIHEVVNNLTNVLNEYAIATQKYAITKKKKDLDNVIRLRRVIQNQIKSYQPENTQEGIFDDIITLLPEESMNRFVNVQKNILSESDDIVPINEEDMTYIDVLAKNFLLGKAGIKLMYENTQDNLDTMMSSFIPKIVNKMSNLPAIPIHNESWRDFVDQATTDISKTTSNIASKCNEAISNNFKSFVSFIDTIINTADQLWNVTPPDYQHKIWGDRSLYVNEDGTLVDPVEQIRLDIILDNFKKSCITRASSIPTDKGTYENLEKLLGKEPIQRALSAPPAMSKQPDIYYNTDEKYSQGSTLLNSQDSSFGSQDTIIDEDMLQIENPDEKRGTKRGSEEQIGPSSSKEPKTRRGGKTKKNKQKSKNVKRKSNKVKRKSGRKTYKRNRKSKRKTRVKN